MVIMENIKSIYTKLSNGKIINDNSSVIKSTDFNSVMADRFRAELKKLGISWDGSDTSLEILTGASTAQTGISETKQTAVNEIFAENNCEIGIDIQHISEMPLCTDFWEDAFYQTNFSKEEIAYCSSKNQPLHSFAGLYAAKEALVKCSRNIKWDTIVIEHTENNKPYYKDYLISISHSGDFAISVAAKIVQLNVTNVLTTEKEIEQSGPANNSKNKKLILLSICLSVLIISYLILKETHLI